jgi:nucleoside-triphosphatase THEP1
VPVPRAILLTGDRGAGKTTLCLALAALSPRCTGVVSPPLFDAAGRRVGFSARCIASADERVLARSDTDLDGPRHGRFSFSSGGIAWAVGCLRGILASAGAGVAGGRAGGAAASRGTAPGATTASHSPVVILDEIGPLELEHGGGFAPVLPLLADAGHLLLVVRRSLVDQVEALVPRHHHEVLVVTPENRGALAGFLLARFD